MLAHHTIADSIIVLAMILVVLIVGWMAGRGKAHS